MSKPSTMLRYLDNCKDKVKGLEILKELAELMAHQKLAEACQDYLEEIKHKQKEA